MYLFENALNKNNTIHFPLYQEIKNIDNQSISFTEFRNIISKKIIEFDTRFKDFDILKIKFELFNIPKEVYVLLQTSDFHMEL